MQEFVNGILHNWKSLCDIRPDCHHHFDASRKVSDESLGKDETYVCEASHNYPLSNAEVIFDTQSSDQMLSVCLCKQFRRVTYCE